MRTPRLSRRAVLAGTAATVAVSAVSVGGSTAQAAMAETPSYRWRNVVIGGTGGEPV